MPPTTTTSRDAALAWLVDRLRFEAVLADLQRRYDATGEPLSFDAEPAPARERTPAAAAA